MTVAVLPPTAFAFMAYGETANFTLNFTEGLSCIKNRLTNKKLVTQQIVITHTNDTHTSDTAYCAISK
jgi:hypothetical protein